MTPRDFKYWLRGFIEISGVDKFKAGQIFIIKDHLDLVQESDEFITWFEGALDSALKLGRVTSITFFEMVNSKLSGEFDSKETPDRDKNGGIIDKEAIQRAVDELEKTKEDIICVNNDNILKPTVYYHRNYSSDRTRFC